MKKMTKKQEAKLQELRNKVYGEYLQDDISTEESRISFAKDQEELRAFELELTRERRIF
ncbi:hypothetical protein Ab1vBOLIVR5_gp11 [Agrobacterium phage OLIVR5]|uniref:Uncharacterized protein n=1 Tax=Agrobacterium phage OLIVR5 TaxID=2723773 RepID=A0A858MST1_9CAUD|nr:hypothetical protein KNU99_gp011 [Agrobacterium phage OLIVR5]QIW87659.1 hypothetical protein Ab1vBOLIVR5_gp11 [Agrobacterium phage OLIVR5]QIW87918.1 hypothetical protein Ab1vBOLIVR6_gp11 [Agrobacterium phage OLIVR6]